MGTWKLELGEYRSDFTFHPNGTMFHSTENHMGTWVIDGKKQRILVYGPGGAGPGKPADEIPLPLDVRGTKGTGANGGMITLTKAKM